MGEWFRDKGHLVRMGGLLAAGVLVFLFVRAIAVPPGFGKYGHFRAGALDDLASLSPVYAGHQACEECHADVVEARQGSKHAEIHCETCHGPAADHAADPSSRTPPLPDPRESCLKCHAASAARPARHPQIVPAEHAPEGPCTACHAHHHPEIEGS
jgi:hypothetical protein